MCWVQAGLVQAGFVPFGPAEFMAGGKRTFWGPKMVVWGPKTHLGGYGTPTGSFILFGMSVPVAEASCLLLARRTGSAPLS